MLKILSLFVCSRLLFVLFSLAAVFFIPLDLGYIGAQIDPNAPYLAWIWANFDGRHFIKIADQGYGDTNFAYFPLYPLLISTLHKTGIPSLWAGVAISSFAFFAGMYLIYKIAVLDFKPQVALTTIILLSLFPLSFFFHSVYADSLFLLLSTTSFYFARKKRWFVSGLFGALTVLTRLSGVALIPALAFEWYLQNKRQGGFKWFAAPLLTLGGLGAYMLYQAINFGDPLLFQKAMVAWRQNEVVFPPQVLFRYLKIFWSVDKNLLVYWIAILEFTTFILYLLLSVYTYKKIRKSYGIFMMLLLSLVAFTGTFAGTPRYLLHLFPAFIGLALLLDKKPRLLLASIILFLILGFLLTGLFTRGYFVA